MLVLSITGHRPGRIKNEIDVRTAMKNQILLISPQKLIQGMAAGVDLWSAQIAFELNIPYIAAKPWATHRARAGGGHAMSAQSLSDYDKAAMHAEKVVNVTDLEYYPGAWAYFKRNEWMVDNSDLLLAVWDGGDGGTKATVDYAIRQGRSIIVLDPDTLETRTINA